MTDKNIRGNISTFQSSSPRTVSSAENSNHPSSEGLSDKTNSDKKSKKRKKGCRIGDNDNPSSPNTDGNNNAFNTSRKFSRLRSVNDPAQSFNGASRSEDFADNDYYIEDEEGYDSCEDIADDENNTSVGEDASRLTSTTTLDDRSATLNARQNSMDIPQELKLAAEAYSHNGCSLDQPDYTNNFIRSQIINRSGNIAFSGTHALDEPTEESSQSQQMTMPGNFVNIEVVTAATALEEQYYIDDHHEVPESIPLHFAQEERNVGIDEGKLTWMSFTNEIIPILPTVIDRLVLKPPVGDCVYDGDFGFALYAKQLKVAVIDGESVCTRDGDAIIKIFAIRRKISTTANGRVAMTPNYRPCENNPGFENIIWAEAGDDDEFIYGIQFNQRQNVNVSFTKHRIFYKEDQHSTTTVRHILVASITSLANDRSRQIILDVFHQFEDRYIRGKMLQPTNYGEVYSALQYRIEPNEVNGAYRILEQQDVALKVVRCPFQGFSTVELKSSFNQQRNENILREIEAMDYLATTVVAQEGLAANGTPSPYINFHCLLKDPNNLYVFTNYYRLGCLFDYIEKNKRGSFLKLTELEAKGVIRQVAVGLGLMHKYGMAHQDLSTENILITAIDENVTEFDSNMLLQAGLIFLLIDFGQVCGHEYDTYHKCFKTLPGRAFCVGKTIYHCPELFLPTVGTTAPIGQRNNYSGFLVDSWQLGILMYVLLLGQPPFNYMANESLRLKIEWLERIRNDDLASQEIVWQEFITVAVPNDEDDGSHQYIETPFSQAKRLDECISANALDLIRRLLRSNPTDRLSMEEVLQHPWLNSTAQTQSVPSIQPIQNPYLEEDEEVPVA